MRLIFLYSSNIIVPLFLLSSVADKSLAFCIYNTFKFTDDALYSLHVKTS